MRKNKSVALSSVSQKKYTFLKNLQTTKMPHCNKKQADKKKGCVRQTTKRYTKADRKAPPYPGTACCGEIKTGNDGNKWESRESKNGSCRWHPMKTRSMTKK